MKVRCCNCGFVSMLPSQNALLRCSKCGSNSFERIMPMREPIKNESSKGDSMLLTEVPSGRSNLMG